MAGYRASSKDLIAPFEYSGTANKDLFLGWFEQILCPNLEPGDYVVIDNASIHKGLEIYDIAEAFKILLKRPMVSQRHPWVPKGS